MCGIAAFLGSVATEEGEVAQLEAVLRRRGPDAASTLRRPESRLVVLAAVLHVRGRGPYPQPAVDASSTSVLAFNGELYSEGDGLIAAAAEDEAVAETPRLLALLSGAATPADLVRRAAALRGPWALIFWHATSRTLWWGRDRIGRRSLLVHLQREDDAAPCTGVVVSSVAAVAGTSRDWHPVRTGGLYSACYAESDGTCTVQLHPWPAAAASPPLTPLQLQTGTNIASAFAAAEELLLRLRIAVRLRVRARSSTHRRAKQPLGVLFSGGLDSMVLAALASEELLEAEEEEEGGDGDAPSTTPIELINVCFDAPRHASPDRLASIAGAVELSRRYPTRVWRLVLVDASFSDLVASASDAGAATRATLERLIAPCTTHMDLNIGTALWFAARGVGDAVDVCGSHTSALQSESESESESGSGSASGSASAAKSSAASTELAAMVAEMLNTAVARPTPKRPRYSADGTPCVVEGCRRIAKPSCPRIMCKLCCKRAFRDDVDASPCVAHGPQRRYVKGSGGRGRGAQSSKALPPPPPPPPPADKGALVARVLSALGPRTRGYTSRARVLLHGAGADEQMAGYARHRSTFARAGAEAVRAELSKEVSQLWTRNLGRDDRCIADSAKEARHPYLDRDVVALLGALPLELVADFTQERGVGDKLILRNVARLLHLDLCATLPKRAIQFGSRISKAANRHIGASRSSRSVGSSTIVW